MDLELLGADAIKALIPVVGTVLVFLVKKVIPKLPRAALPMIAMGLGFGLDWLAAFAVGGTFTPIVGALLGASSVWLREVVSTVKEHGLQA